MFQHWSLHEDTQQVVWLTFDKKDASVNSLNKAVLEEFATILQQLAKNNTIKGLVIASGKKTGFIAGADIDQFEHLNHSTQATQFIRQGQEILQHLAQLSFPTIAMIQGFCLGGGLELALACHYRIAEDHPSTRLGLPEVKLGIHPGWGGTIRLPKLIGAPQALSLILSGKTISARQAASLGIVDEAVPERQLLNAVHFYLKTPPQPHTAGLLQQLSNRAWIRLWLAKWMEYQLHQKVREQHYPAPFKALRLWEKNGVDGGEHAYLDEATSLGELITTDTAKNLLRVFHLQEHLKSLAKKSDCVIQHVHVVGAGTMGGDIAAWCALRGLKVTLQDRTPERIAPAIARAYDLFKKRLKLVNEVQIAMDRLTPDLTGKGIIEADLIIEAIFENLEAKQILFKEVEKLSKPSALLATNTSSIPLDEISQVLQQPERLVGIHFFNPVAVMQLIEVVHSEKTAPTTLNQAITFVRKIDHLPLPVKSYPGFLVNRTLMPYLMECMLLLEENIPPEVIDEAALRFGMPMGPAELADTVGLDICLSVAQNLLQYFGGEIPRCLEEKVAAKHLGKKTQQGFYLYRDDHKVTQKINFAEYDLEPIQDRLILRFINEAIACWREDIAPGLDDIDAGLIFGTGFAPFRGGPLHYAETVGYKNIKKKLLHYQQLLGNRFAPDAMWDELIHPTADVH